MLRPPQSDPADRATDLSTTPAGHPQIAFIQILRGVAALLVVWSHLSGYWLSLVGRTSAAQDLWYQWVVRPLHLYQNGGHLGVIVFFLISGYIITHTSLRESRLSFAVKRVFRIAPGLLVAVLVTWLVVVVASSSGLHLLAVHNGPWYRWVEALFLVDGFTGKSLMLDVTWTLVVEVIFYLLVFAFLGLQRRRPLASTWAMAGVWLAGSVVFLNLPQLSSHANGWAMFWVGFLLVGRGIYLVHHRLVSLGDGVLLVAAVLLAFGVLAETAEPGHLLAPGGWTGLEPLVTYIIAILLFVGLLRLAPKRAVPPFGYLGDISYSLYLFHLPVGFLVIALLDAARLPETVTSVVAVLVSVVVATASWWAIERPTQRIARRILASRRDAPTAGV